MSDEHNASSSFSRVDPVEISHAPIKSTVKSYGISIDSSKIDEVAYEEQPESLRELGVNVFDQDVFEEGVLQQVDEAIAAQKEALEKQRLEKDLKTVEEELRITEHEINKTRKNQQTNKLLVLDHEKLERKKEHLLQRLCITKDIQEPVTDSLNEECTAHLHYERKEHEISVKDSAERLLHIGDYQETEVERLIRLGEMTPFGNTVNNSAQMDTAEVSSGEKKAKMVLEKGILALSSQFEGEARQSTSEARTTDSLAVIKSCVDDDNDDDVHHDDSDYNFLNCFDDEVYDNVPQLETDDDYIPDDEELKLSWKEDLMSEDETNSEEKVELSVKAKKKKKHKRKPVKKNRTKDDGDDMLFQKRTREAKLKKILWEKGIDYSGKSDEEEAPWHESFADEEFEGGLKIPGAVWNKLFRYQKTGVKWLWELHCQQAGGIVGDEMGLGKTIQLIAFLAGLKYSKIGRRTSKGAGGAGGAGGLGPVLIVCPATVMYQWVAEFHKWWPEFRVAVLHDIGSYQGPKDVLINKIRNSPGVLITTYSGVRINQEHLLPSRWDYVILDEGHTIRNPDAEVTLACKQFRTPHRIVLSGSPMQNNLRELWSLFDFVFPGKLGTLPVFMQEFSVPITMGGYANATQVQVQTAYKCACVLRDTINPYLLRRLKKDVKLKLNLPNKNEQVLFCRLTEEQTEIYKEYLDSREVGSILSGSMKVFAGLIMLRKICNHPDLTTQAGSLWKLRKDQKVAAETVLKAAGGEIDSEYGSWKRSGKLVVVQSLLKLWKKQKHKVLLFTQTRQMLKIFEIFVKSQGYEYCHMDGTTSISSRQPLIERFNKDKSIFVFILTTRVGGLGVNLVGANRVIIYDPDWNPGTDMQARERAWRIGQKKDVTIYRLLTTGTIEEKIYHRQIFKQFLTNRVLKDPKQRRFFKSNDLFELFTLDTSDNTKTGTETSAIFAGLGCEVQVPSLQRKLKGTKRKNPEELLQDSASVLKMMKKKTQEILRTQFPRSKETIAQPSNDEPHKSEMNRDSAVSSGDNCMDIKLPMSVSCDVPTVSTCTPGPTVDSDGMTKCNEAMTGDLEDGVRRDTSVSICLEQLSAEGNPCGGLCDITGTASNSEITNVAHTQTFSENGEENNFEEGKMEKLDQSSSIPRKKDKGKMRKRKKKKRNKIEGIRIGHLSHSEPYVSKKDSEDGRDDDHYILRKLFEKSGVHSALQHDTIVNSGNSDDILVENEAKRVAAQAVAALQRSRERYMLHWSSGLPTWTGQSGFVGSPHGVATKAIFGPKAKQKKQCKENDASEHFSGESLLGKTALQDDETKATCTGPMSSTQLLARMRSRNFIGGNNTGSEAPSTEQKYEQTMAEVRSFIATRCARPGMATTREILEEFSARLPVSDSAIFRAMLRTICDFDRGVSGEGYWVLKAELSGESGPLTRVHAEDNLAELGAS